MKTKRLPPLNSLQAFEAAGRHESFLEAAAEHDVTSGSISRHVRLLENHLGTERFVRRSNGVALTAAGKEYAGAVSAIFRELRSATDRVREPAPDRALVIATLPIFSERWLYRRIPSFREAFGRTELRIEAHNGAPDCGARGRGCMDPVLRRTPSRLQRHAAVRRGGLSRVQPAVPRDAVGPPIRVSGAGPFRCGRGMRTAGRQRSREAEGKPVPGLARRPRREQGPTPATAPRSRTSAGSA